MKTASLIIDFYKKYRRNPFDYSFKEDDPVKNLKSALPVAWKMPPKKALEHLKKRGANLITTDRWDELDAEAHNKSFTVAKVMSADLLQTIYDHVEKAKSEGWTLKKFQEQLMPKLESAGWAGAKPSRLKVIYDTNLQIAYAQNKYKQQKLIADIYPYLKYVQVERGTKRDEHSKLDGKTFHHEDKIWEKIYPPSDHECKCSVVSLKKSEAGRIYDGEEVMKDLDDKEFQISPLKAWEPDTKKYVSGIQKKLDKMLGDNKPDKQKTTKNKPEPDPKLERKLSPEELIQQKIKAKIKEKLDVEMPEEFYKLFKEDITVRTQSNSVKAYYKPTKKLLFIGLRRFNTDNLKKHCIAHEGMHAGHVQHNIVTLNHVDPEIKEVFDKTLDTLMSNYGRRLYTICNELRQRRNREFYRDNYEDEEKCGAALDTVCALTKGRYGEGHSQAYWNSNENIKYMEFLAHCSEYHFSENKYMRDNFPEIYTEMKDLAKKIFDDL